ncbi:hypothetical protein [Pseudaminobacter soli (ex Li et al. 2025)]|nr:hypothetical protein [Mesorhizobium soli]
MLVFRDVIDSDGNVCESLPLRAEVTKGRHARVIFLNGRLRREAERHRR